MENRLIFEHGPDDGARERAADYFANHDYLAAQAEANAKDKLPFEKFQRSVLGDEAVDGMKKEIFGKKETEAAKALAEATKDRAVAKETFESNMVLADLQAKLGDQFARVLDFANKGNASGEIKATDLTADLGLGNGFKLAFRKQITDSLSKVSDDDWEKLTKVFDVKFETGDLANFKAKFSEFMVRVAEVDLEKKLRAETNLKDFPGFVDHTVKIDYTVASLASTITVRDASEYAKFKQEKADEVKETKEKEKAKTDEEAMLQAIKKNGGLIGALFLMFAKTKDKDGRTGAEKLLAGENPFLATIFGMRGVEFAPFQEAAKGIEESAGNDPRFAKLYKSVSKMVGQGKGVAEKAGNAVKGLVGADLASWITGGAALTAEASLSEGYNAADKKALKLTLAQGKKLVLGEGKYRLSTAVGSLREVVVKDGAPEEIAPAFGSNELFVQALAKNTKLPAGTKAEVIDLTT